MPLCLGLPKDLKPANGVSNEEHPPMDTIGIVCREELDTLIYMSIPQSGCFDYQWVLNFLGADRVIDMWVKFAVVCIRGIISKLPVEFTSSLTPPELYTAPRPLCRRHSKTCRPGTRDGWDERIMTWSVVGPFGPENRRSAQTDQVLRITSNTILNEEMDLSSPIPSTWSSGITSSDP
ncbi:hypothetical protein NYO67_6999 [Aspergillus flavus]|nr:hypothetical protein NYO67_6999 [Aspergillus flavus]